MKKPTHAKATLEFDPDFLTAARAIYGWEPDEGYTHVPVVPPVEAIAAALWDAYVAGLDTGWEALIHAAAEVCVAAQHDRLRRGRGTRQQLDDWWRSEILDVGVRIRARADALCADAAHVGGKGTA